MATLIEEINLRIAAHGGRDKLIRSIEQEWRVPFREKELTNMHAKNKYSEKEELLLSRTIKNLSIVLRRNPYAIATKIYVMGQHIRKAGHF